MIELHMEGLIGNNLFQYALARILAEDLGYALETTHSPYNPTTNAPWLVELMSYFHDAPLNLPGRSVDHPVDKTAWLGHEGFDGFRVDLEAMRNDKTNRRILIRGFFERYEIFRGHKERLRTWFRTEPFDRGFDIAKDDVVMHIRRGDFIVRGRAISLTYYLNIMKELDFRKLYICGIGVDKDVERSFGRYDPIYVNGSPVDDFRFIRTFNRIIQSQSTFSWWAGFLSDAEELYAPLTIPNSTDFEREYPHIDLRVDDESRYRYVQDVSQLERPTSVRDVINALPLLSPREAIDALRYEVLSPLIRARLKKLFGR
jgi:hypothetical protein